MSVKKKFSPEEVEELRANPYTERVTAEQISFTLTFKEEFWRLSVEGCTGNIAFRRLGYDPEVLGFERVHNITKRIRRATRTAEGLQGKADQQREFQPRRAGEDVPPGERAAPSKRDRTPPAADGVFKKAYAAAWQAGLGAVTMERTSFRFGAIRAALAEEGNVLTVTELCDIAGVSRSGYYGWVKAEQARQDREARDKSDFQLILNAYRFRGYDKGVRGIHMRLLHTGIRMNPKKIRRLMRKYELFCPVRKVNPYRRLQKAIRTNNTAENLVNREFETHGPRSILLTDITYIPLNGAHCYLSTILDACTKQVLSYTLSESLGVDFVLETVEKLVKNHGTSLNKKTILHSDQGCHYTCVKFIQLLKNSALRQSMSRRGNCWDNAPQESFFGHMKDELSREIPGWNSFADAERSIGDWIDYYNNDRYQWDLAKLSPNEYYDYLISGIYPSFP